MNLTDIINNVRLCIDEQSVNDASFSDLSGDTTKMDNIIQGKIGDALLWLCMNAPTNMLYGTDTRVENEDVPTGIITTDTVAEGDMTNDCILMPTSYIRLVRLFTSSWSRAVSELELVTEDSEEFLEFSDTTARATAERPKAAIIRSDGIYIKPWPVTEGASYDYTCITLPPYAVGDTTIPLPPLCKSAFIYYIAFLVLSAYGDARANNMLSIANINIGRIPQ